MDKQLYLKLNKNPNVLKAIKSKESGVKFHESFFNDQDIEFLKKIFISSLDNSSQIQYRHENHEKSNLMVNPEGQLKAMLNEFLLTRLKPILKEEVKIEFSFHKNYRPYGIHTDSGYDPNETIFRQGIIPLEVSPVNTSVYTIIFNQKCYFSSNFPFEGLDLEKTFWVDGIVDENLSSELLSKYWVDNEYYRHWLRGLSFNSAFEWAVGSMATWDRSLIHCSNDFSLSECQYKLGLMWVSQLV